MAEPLETETPFQSSGLESDDAFNAALREYEAATPQAPEPQPEQASPEPETFDDLVESFKTSAKAEDESTGRQELYQHAETLTAAARSIDAERQRIRGEQESWDFERALGTAEQELGVQVPGALAPMFLGMYKTDPAFKEAWDRRSNDPVQWEAAFGRAVRQIGEMFDTRHDKNATEDRWAVSDAVRGGRGGAPAASPLPSLSKMTDAELKQFSRDNFGFDILA